jgi:uncharacterized membrane protein
MASVAGTPKFHRKAARTQSNFHQIKVLALELNWAYSGISLREEKTMPDNQIPPLPPAAAGEDKTIAIIAYLTLIGFIVALILHMNKKTKLGAFHLRQMLGLILTGVAVGICGFVLIFIPIIGWLCHWALLIAIFVLWVMGLIAAINGEMKPVPIVGPLYQKWFGTAFD